MKEKNKEKKEPELEKIAAEPVFEKDLGEVLATWDFPEFIKHERGKLWYILFGVIFLAMIIYSYFSDNLLFAIIIALFIITYFSLERRGPINIQVAITEDGILINSKFFAFEDLQDFYIIYYPPQVKNLYFQPKNHLRPAIVWPLEDENPVTIRRILLQYLPEDLEKEEIPASESVSKILRL